MLWESYGSFTVDDVYSGAVLDDVEIFERDEYEPVHNADTLNSPAVIPFRAYYLGRGPPGHIKCCPGVKPERSVREPQDKNVIWVKYGACRIA